MDGIMDLLGFSAALLAAIAAAAAWGAGGV